LTEPRDGA